MPKLKMIGGPMDGREQFAPPGHTTFEYQELPKIAGRLSSKEAMTLTVTRHTYKVQVYNYPEGNVSFLVHEDLSTKEAMERLLAAYQEPHRYHNVLSVLAEIKDIAEKFQNTWGLGEIILRLIEARQSAGVLPNPSTQNSPVDARNKNT